MIGWYITAAWMPQKPDGWRTCMSLHDATLRLMLTTFRGATLLDASKTGLRLLKEVEKADEAEYGNPAKRAKCFDTKSRSTQKREQKLGPFVLDLLLAAGMVTRDKLMVELDAVCIHDKGAPSADVDIRKPYNDALGVTSKDISGELELLKAFVDTLRNEWSREAAKSSDPWQTTRSRKKGHSKQTDNLMLPIMRKFRRPIEGIHQLVLLGIIDEIKASYAFTLSERFGFSMAFQDICEIKRKVEKKRGPQNKVAVVDDVKNVGAAARRLLKHMGDA
jgi:RNA-dependent RNA polymerase